MKSKHPHLRALILALTLAAQLALLAPTSSAAQNTSDGNRNLGIPGSACRRRCQNSYRRCLRRNGRAYCRRQLRRCLNNCPQ